MALKMVFDYAVGCEAARVAVDALRGCCRRVEVAGSVRRGKRVVHDVDLVVWPMCELVGVGPVDLFGGCEQVWRAVGLLETLERVWGVAVGGEYPRKVVLPGEDGGPEWARVPVEVYVAEADGGNFEALWQMRTGSEAFNVSLATRAKRYGYVYRAGYGIFNLDGQRVDDGTEAGVFAALGIPWIAPELRETDFRLVVGKI